MAAGTLALAGSTAAMLRGVEPFATWYYVFAWYATLLVLDGVAALLGDGRLGLFGRPAHLATLVTWSAVTWLFFELLNLRLQNWYYVLVPEDGLARWLGVPLAFGTVFPAVFAAEALLARLGVAEKVRWRPLVVSPELVRALRAVGVLALVLPLVWPGVFYPLVWISLALLLEPFNHRRDPARSLLGDFERGKPGRLVRLLAGGAAVGLLWELYNARARAKWIYTVPGFETGKLFEMPVAGFLGFPPFALECFAVWQALVLAGLAVPREGRARRTPARQRALAAAVALAFATIAAAGMERLTITSYEPAMADLPGVPAADLERVGYDVFSLAEADAAAVAWDLAGEGASPSPLDEVQGWIERARLTVLKGIGTENLRRLERAGISSIAELAAADAERLTRQLAAQDAGVPGRRVRLWVQAAQRQLDTPEPSRP